MAGMSVTFDYEDIKKFKRTCSTLGEKTAIRAAQKAAQKGSNVVGKAIRQAAPKRTGALRSGFKKKKERSKSNGKVVYQYAMDSAKNEIFQSQIKEAGKYGGKKSTGYYPASVEYGYLTSDGTGALKYSFSPIKKRRSKSQHYGSRKVEGQHFVKKASESAANEAQSTMKKVLNEELDKAWRK